MKKILLIITSILTLLIISLLLIQKTKPVPEKELPGKIRVATGTSTADIPFIAAIETGEFKRQGIEVETDTSFGTSGFKNIGALIDDKVDIAPAGTYPFVYKSLTEVGFPDNNIIIFATYLTSYYGIKVLVLKKSGIEKGEYIEGKRIALAVNTQIKYYIDSLLVNYKILPDEVTIVDTPLGSEIDTFINDTADVVVTIEPFITNILTQFGEKVEVLEVDRVIRSNMNFLTTIGYAKNNRDKLIAFLKAIDKSCEFLESKSPESLKFFSDFFSIEEEVALKIVDETKLGLLLDQLLLISMENEARWIIRQEGLSGKSVPNYLPYIYSDILSEVKPEAVTIIVE
jgi:NitT/TauT family transport system substrate-binding protein